jgi:hypothetical protein
MRSAFTLACLLLLASAAAKADVYRWVDSSGRVHYSDRWVPGSELVKITRPAASPTATATRLEGERGRLRASDQRIQEQQAQVATTNAVRQDVAAKRAEQCKAAREHYEKTVTYRRLYKTGANGEREYLSDPEADKLRVEARTEMDAVCGKSS